MYGRASSVTSAQHDPGPDRTGGGSRDSSGSSLVRIEAPGTRIDFIAKLDEALESVALLPSACPLWKPERPFRKKKNDPTEVDHGG
jgi:hypothetical protein